MPSNTTSSRCVLKQTPGHNPMTTKMKLLVLNNHQQGKTHLTAFGSGS